MVHAENLHLLIGMFRQCSNKNELLFVLFDFLTRLGWWGFGNFIDFLE